MSVRAAWTCKAPSCSAAATNSASEIYAHVHALRISGHFIGRNLSWLRYIVRTAEFPARQTGKQGGPKHACFLISSKDTKQFIVT
jgi:hypothetical protein